jgi:hypothetical protein
LPFVAIPLTPIFLKKCAYTPPCVATGEKQEGYATKCKKKSKSPESVNRFISLYQKIPSISSKIRATMHPKNMPLRDTIFIKNLVQMAKFEDSQYETENNQL